MWYVFSITIFIFVTNKDVISLTQTNLIFWRVCQRLSLRELLIFSLIFCQLRPGVAYKRGAYKNKCAYHSGYNYSTIEGIANYLLQHVLYGSAFKIMNYDSFTFYHLLRPFDIGLTPDDSKLLLISKKLTQVQIFLL